MRTQRGEASRLKDSSVRALQNDNARRLGVDWKTAVEGGAHNTLVLRGTLGAFVHPLRVWGEEGDPTPLPCIVARRTVAFLTNTQSCRTWRTICDK